ncbi:plexin domain-containing protein 1-like [Betta splendens]|uniref:Plexin domain-containing protein 1-like n=1 Tax=Betta splendens TaxID=158456 RepID=A0A6P7N3D6_BETSP|nr:plexin domain-containing protein 1-like [Betta splendens]
MDVQTFADGAMRVFSSAEPRVFAITMATYEGHRGGGKGCSLLDTGWCVEGARASEGGRERRVKVGFKEKCREEGRRSVLLSSSVRLSPSNMCFSLVTLFLCLSQTEPTKVWLHQQTDDQYTVQQIEESTGGDSHLHRAQRSSSGHVISRAVLGGELTIDILPDNMTRIVEDSGKYYTWRSFGPEDQRTQELWVDMSDVRHGQVRVHGILSNSYKQAVNVALSFDFPFYGHYLKQISIATGGFIFTGDSTHRMLTATQYIAPLMANFDPSYSRESTVQYLDNGELFVVQWERVRLFGKESAGAFTFQAALYKTGTITFSYRDVPLSLDVISSAQHPVKAGLSDAFIVTAPSSKSPDAQRRTIYEYDRVEINTSKIINYSAVEFTPLPTCLKHDSCELCLSSNQTSGCSWCNVLQRCSDGMDRHRQEWLDYGCSEQDKDATCEDYSKDESFTGSYVPPERKDVTSLIPQQKSCKSDDENSASSTRSEGLGNVGVIAGIAAALVLLLALVFVVLYINYHPTAASSLYLIQRRKNYWPSFKFQKQQPGYTEVEGDGHEKNSIVEAGPY